MSAVERLLNEDSPRADAKRNVQRLVAAAREAIAEVGVGVTAHEIARRAGVGIGTFYRRLPSREALLQAVVEDTVREIAELARRALLDPDPWHGFSTFAVDFVQLRAMSCGINEALGTDCAFTPHEALAELREQVRLLVERCQQAGVIRRDVPWQDVPFALTAVKTGDRTIGLPAAEDQWERNLRIVLTGLRADR